MPHKRTARAEWPEILIFLYSYRFLPVGLLWSKSDASPLNEKWCIFSCKLALPSQPPSPLNILKQTETTDIHWNSYQKLPIKFWRSYRKLPKKSGHTACGPHLTAQIKTTIDSEQKQRNRQKGARVESVFWLILCVPYCFSPSFNYPKIWCCKRPTVRTSLPSLICDRTHRGTARGDDRGRKLSRHTHNTEKAHNFHPTCFFHFGT